jgi:hypothetical protein
MLELVISAFPSYVFNFRNCKIVQFLGKAPFNVVGYTDHIQNFITYALLFILYKALLYLVTSLTFSLIHFYYVSKVKYRTRLQDVQSE